MTPPPVGVKRARFAMMSPDDDDLVVSPDYKLDSVSEIVPPVRRRLNFHSIERGAVHPEEDQPRDEIELSERARTFLHRHASQSFFRDLTTAQALFRYASGATFKRLGVAGRFLVISVELAEGGRAELKLATIPEAVEKLKAEATALQAASLAMAAGEKEFEMKPYSTSYTVPINMDEYMNVLNNTLHSSTLAELFSPSSGGPPARSSFLGARAITRVHVLETPSHENFVSLGKLMQIATHVNPLLEYRIMLMLYPILETVQYMNERGVYHFALDNSAFSFTSDKKKSTWVYVSKFADAVFSPMYARYFRQWRPEIKLAEGGDELRGVLRNFSPFVYTFGRHSNEVLSVYTIYNVCVLYLSFFSQANFTQGPEEGGKIFNLLDAIASRFETEILVAGQHEGDILFVPATFETSIKPDDVLPLVKSELENFFAENTQNWLNHLNAKTIQRIAGGAF